MTRPNELAAREARPSIGMSGWLARCCGHRRLAAARLAELSAGHSPAGYHLDRPLPGPPFLHGHSFADVRRPDPPDPLVRLDLDSLLRPPRRGPQTTAQLKAVRTQGDGHPDLVT